MKPFTPSSSDLERMIEDAMRKFDQDREQAILADAARANERYSKAWIAETKAKTIRRNWK